jgi:hypothetical protein
VGNPLLLPVAAFPPTASSTRPNGRSPMRKRCASAAASSGEFLRHNGIQPPIGQPVEQRQLGGVNRLGVKRPTMNPYVRAIFQIRSVTSIVAVAPPEYPTLTYWPPCARLAMAWPTSARRRRR